MKTYYVIVDAYVPAEDVVRAFKTATARYKMRHPRLHVETIAAHGDGRWAVDPAFVLLCEPLVFKINDYGVGLYVRHASESARFGGWREEPAL